MDFARIVEKAQTLGDVELALLLSLMAGQHCQIDADVESVSSLKEEIGLVRHPFSHEDHYAQITSQICSRVFGFSHSAVQCSSSTTLDNFREALLVDEILSAECIFPDPESHRVS